MVLELKQSFGSKTLLKAKSECERFASEFEQLSFQQANNPVAKTTLSSASRHWKKNAEECDAKLERTRVSGARCATRKDPLPVDPPAVLQWRVLRLAL